MAYTANTSIYQSNSIPGQLTGTHDADIYEVNSTPKFAVGTGMSRADGNKYRYANFVTATGPGKLVSHIVANVDMTTTNVVVAPVSTYQMSNEPNGVYPGAIGSRYVILTVASVVKGQYAGGYFCINDSYGEGYSYRIKGNTATDDPASGKIRLELYDPLVVALTTASYVCIVGSLYTDCYIATPGTDMVTVGVTQANMTANTYGWVCTHGVTSCLTDGTVAVGDVVQPSVVTGGAVQTAGVGTTSVAALVGQNIVGFCVSAANTTEYSMIFLQLE